MARSRYRWPVSMASYVGHEYPERALFRDNASRPISTAGAAPVAPASPVTLDPSWIYALSTILKPTT